MTEKKTRWLTYHEELAMAVFFSNVEKFRCLSNMELFNQEILTKPLRLWNKDDAPLVTILACYKILYAIPGNKKWKERNDAIVGMVKERCGMEITEDIDLSAYNPEGVGDILHQRDYKRMISWVSSCREGGYGPQPESWDNLKSFYRYIPTNALREQHLARLEKRYTESERNLILKKVREEHQKSIQAWEKSHAQPLSKEIKQFIDKHDREGAILALFDEGKGFLAYTGLYYTIIRYVLSKTQHITIRVGGYSYRAEKAALHISTQLKCKPERLESIYCDYYKPSVDYGDANAKFFELYDYLFDYEMELVKYAEQYDYKTFSMNGENHPMVYYYVNNIDTGWYSEDGEFHGFYDKRRGLQALGDVIMIRGYKDIRPATCAIFTDSGRDYSNEIYCGNMAHFDRKTRAGSQRQLFEDARIPYLDIGGKEG